MIDLTQIPCALLDNFLSSTLAILLWANTQKHGLSHSDQQEIPRAVIDSKNLNISCNKIMFRRFLIKRPCEWAWANVLAAFGEHIAR